MSRKVLLIEPNYKNKYPPMGLMKIATYFRRCGDDVRFYKGDLRLFAAHLLCEEFYAEVNEIKLGKYFHKLTEYIKTGKYSHLDEIPDFRNSEYEDIIKTYRQRFVRKDYAVFDFVGITTLFTFYWKQTVDTINAAKAFCKSDGTIKLNDRDKTPQEQSYGVLLFKECQFYLDLIALSKSFYKRFERAFFSAVSFPLRRL